MSKLFAQIVFFLACPAIVINAYADSISNSIVRNKDIELCVKKNGSIDSECLSSVSKKTENELNQEYQNKLKEISSYDYSQWWMGQKKQREEMKESFIRSQTLWDKYREEYCKSASTGGEGVDGYSLIVLSCQTNMAIRRIEEIKMVHPDLSDG
ncbi:lysozyme inhibitor LprI family protein [Pluralibacter gergoviae]|uniref:Lysozyme inhibitor LprI family protein n=1 Tax=Pluralibacter gergoviae TaxID=61647 RepID=A0AAW8HTR0_PLUGE|nr:lysozyme inhibitor LprI family protein [Pluralibacter gergoviae]AIR01387.1 hypothetical protein LG71_16480 [Pluralibacter gergoviae]AVR04332.1 DUF1311 domain-containing protein [Pluralibacter gergoviae]EKV0932494.1 DUF1311 domain-containing protein [Pluralibacter gergoviae]EKV6248105.1 DUF1311 domain-containing protein [Pluralibacter gergoviae]EKW6619393.1 DUF1311 domain-containing protein [Pluralibacter gergoviae]